MGDAGEYGDPVDVKNNDNDGVDGNVNCGVLGGANAETDKRNDGTTEQVGESVPGDRVCMPNAVSAETIDQRPRIILASLVCWLLEFTLWRSHRCHLFRFNNRLSKLPWWRGRLKFDGR